MVFDYPLVVLNNLIILNLLDIATLYTLDSEIEIIRHPGQAAREYKLFWLTFTLLSKNVNDFYI